MKKLLLLLFSIPFLGFSQGSMDFENVILPASYSDGTFDEAGITYTYGHSRDQETYPIIDNGLMLRRASESYLEWTIPNGVGELSFQYRKAFTGAGERQLEVYVNNVVVATTPTFGIDVANDEVIYDFTQNIDLDGEVVIKIKNVGTSTANKQTTLDNIAWTAFEGGSSEPTLVEATIQVGSGTTGSSYFPNYYLYDYSYTQTIYTAAELHAAGAQVNGGEISMIRYLPKATVSTEKWRNFAVYMINTSKEGFDSSTDWIEFGSLIEVFDGDLANNTVANEWLEITLDLPFDWNGSDNILVAVVDKTPSYGNSPNWAGYTLAPATGSKGIYRYRDGTQIDLEDPASGTTGSKGTSNSVAQIQFFGTLQESCTGTPSVGVVSESLEVCAATSFTLSSVGATSGFAGITYQWQISDDGTTWTDIAGANATSITVTSGVNEETNYRFIVTCAGSNESTTSGTIVISINPNITECYCTPSATNSSRFINNFTTTGGTQNIENLATGFSTDGYGDFTTMIAEQVQSGTVEFTGTINGGSAGFKIWVDWNQNGVFESTEVAFQTNGYTETPNGSFTVPLDALTGSTRMRIVSNWSSTTGGSNPCATAYASGEFEDYTFNVTELAGCTGTPDAGTVADLEVCATTSFDLTTDGVSTGEAGFTYQWQESADGTAWSDIAGATSASYTMTDGITEETSYRLVVTCENSLETATSDAIVATIKAALDCYCTPTTSSSEYLSSIEIASTNGAISYSASAQPNNPAKGYDDQTVQVIETFPTDIVSVNTLYNGGANTVKVWVDWNVDGTFSETELMDEGYVTAATTLNENSFIVPAGTPAGEYRMRVRGRWSTTAFDACGVITYGSAVDFTVSVIALSNCDLVDAGIATESFSTCTLTPFTLSTASSSDYAEGMTAIWQSSPAGMDDWSDIAGAISTSYTVSAGISEATDYRYKMTCSFSTNEDVSNTVEVTLSAPSECYCETNYSSAIEPITLVEIKDGSNVLLTNSTPASGGVAHEDFTSISANVARDGDYEITVKGYTGGSFTNKVAIYIDWNQDGNFDVATEQYLFPDLVNSSGEDAIESVGTITIPATALLGSTRMRVTKKFSSVALPCNTGGFGQTEDYTLVIEEAETVDCTTFLASIAGDAEICEGAQTTLTVTATEAIASVEWDNGATGTELVVTDAGTYTATVTSEDGCIEEVSFEVTVNALPTVDAIDVTDNGSGSYTFAAVDATNADDYAWDFGNGDTSTDENPTYVYTINGTYTVTLTVSNTCGSADVTSEVEFTGGIDCSTFTASIDGDAEICEGNETTLTVTASEAIASVEWNNGATGTELVVTETGTYTATVTSEDGCIEEVSFMVTVNALPTVGAIDVTDNGSGSYTFAAVDATNADDYAWDFGNGDTSADENPTYVYTTEGTYTVTLTVSNACGSADASAEVTYTEPFDCSTFTTSIDGDAEICEGNETTLTVTASADIASVEWNNSETGTELVVTEAGTYTATVTSVDGCVETATFEVTVNPLPTVAGINVTENGEGSYTFAATDATDATVYAWDFGDGVTSNDENPTHVYAEEGTYTVTLTVTNDCGTATVTETVVYDETGLAENELINLNVFPNPSREYVNVVYDGSYSIETIVVISPIGQKVFEVNVNGNNYQLDVNKYATGIYHMNIILTNGKMISRNFDVMK